MISPGLAYTGHKRSLEIVFAILPSSGVSVCDYLAIPVNGPIARGKSLWYDSFADLSAAVDDDCGCSMGNSFRTFILCCHSILRLKWYLYRRYVPLRNYLPFISFNRDVPSIVCNLITRALGTTVESLGSVEGSSTVDGPSGSRKSVELNGFHPVNWITRLPLAYVKGWTSVSKSPLCFLI